MYSHLVPGGWAEFHEWGCEFLGEDALADERYKQSSLATWLEYTIASGAALGRDLRAPVKYQEYMTEAGFTDIVKKEFLVPM